MEKLENTAVTADSEKMDMCRQAKEINGMMKIDPDFYHAITQYTLQMVKEDIDHWKGVPPEPYSGEPKILFMGTGGNPVNLQEQPRQTGGFVLYLPGCTLAVDPGPGAIQHVKSNRVDTRGLDGIYISHGHTDHYLGAPLLIEGMTWLMSQRRGKLMLPPDVLNEELISLYHQGRCNNHEGYSGGPAELISLTAGQEIVFSGGVTLTPVKAYHGKDNFGFVLKTPDMTIGYTSDTSYLLEYENLQGELLPVEKWEPMEQPRRITKVREDLREIFRQVDYLIANVSYFNLFAHRHITAVGLAHLLECSQVKCCWMTHFDACYTRPKSLGDDMARFVQELTGVKTVAAQDNREYYFA